MSANHECELLIIGAGPAGCAAALYGARAGLTTIMFSPSLASGMMAVAPKVGNYPGQVDLIPGRELLARMREQALLAGAEHRLEAVLGVDLGGERRQLFTGGGAYDAGAIIVATGATARSRKTPGEEEMVGRGVSYCAACDGPLYRDQDVLVVGGDEEAAQEALGLSGVARSVTLVCPTAAIKASPETTDALAGRGGVQVRTGWKLQKIVGDQGVTGAVFAGPDGAEETLAATGVFLYLRGAAPDTAFLQGAVAVDDKGFITTDELCETSISRVFAAGDVRSKRARQIVIAAAEGCTAALAAERMLRGRPTMRIDRCGTNEPDAGQVGEAAATNVNQEELQEERQKPTP